MDPMTADVCTPYPPATPDGSPQPVSPRWRTETVLTLARGIRTDGAFDRMPILADALEEAGCDDLRLLNHCRYCERHTEDCWALDLVYSLDDWFEPDQAPEPSTSRVTPFQVVERVSEATSRVVRWGFVVGCALMLLTAVIQFFFPSFLGPKPAPPTTREWQPEVPPTFLWKEAP